MVHYIIYIHDVVRPFPETALSPKLMVIKYLFIADHLNFGAESPIEKKKELVLHFGTLDKMGEEGDLEFICFNDIVLADTEQDRWTVSHDFQKLEDLRMSSGFKDAGYHISAAIGYDTQCYQPWKIYTQEHQ
ncbi:hypothetical protein KXW58_006119 [Aspergillus fumigatus]|nr:hypothetical protein KXW58_006119 [Aspergillus fumigatus]